MMTLHILRALFVLLMASVGYWFLLQVPGPFGAATWTTMAVSVTVAILILSIDILASRRKLINLSAVLFGTVVGMAIAYILGFAVAFLVDRFVPGPLDVGSLKYQLVGFLQMLVNISCCYLLVSFIMQTKDDIRFIIPYVEFAKQTKGAKPVLLDSSVLIDGRVSELAELGLLDSRLVVPRFVLDELQMLADSSDRLRRGRGRRGLDLVGKLQGNRKVEVVIYDLPLPEGEAMPPVDQRLVATAGEMNARIMTTDYNLEKVAQLQGVAVLNINEIAAALRPAFHAGDSIEIQLIKPGEQSGQAVGYLDDGTMVVVEHARQHIGQDMVQATVTSVTQSAVGRMVFARLGDGTSPRKGRGRENDTAAEQQQPTSTQRPGV